MKFETFLILSFVISSISFTISTTSMFTWLREILSSVHEKLEELIHCPWCLSHWVIIVMFVLLSSLGVQPYNVSGNYFLDFIITGFAMTFVSGLGHYVLLRAYKPVMENMMMRKMEKLQQKK